MAKVSLTSYLIRVKDSTGNTIKFNEVEDDLGNKIEFHKILNRYFQSRQNLYSDNEDNKKILSVSKNIMNTEKDGNLIKYHLLKGIIKAGSYGYSSEIFDKDTGKIEYIKPPTSAEMLPFYYEIFLPPGKEKGICIFQRFSQYGIKSGFERDINLFLNDLYPHINIELNPLLPEDYLKNFFDQGEVKKLRFIKHEVATDIAERLGDNGIEETIGEVEYVIKARRSKGIPVNNRFSKIFSKGTDITSMFEITNFDYNNIKVELKLNGEIKTVDMGKIDKINGSYDITKDIEFGDNGHPTFESISEKSKEYGENFLNNMGLIFEKR